MKQQQHLPRACPICGKNAGKVLGELAYALFDDLQMSGKKTLIYCRECGMRYDDVEFSEEKLHEYYFRNDHYAGSLLGGSGSITDANKARYDRIIGTLNPGKDDFILDFGCGQGGFVSRCLERGFKAAGIEPSPKSRGIGNAEGLDLSESLASFSSGHPGRKIGAIVVSHVLEHLLNPLCLLRDLARRAPKAKVYIEVPDSANYLAPKNIRWHEMYFEHFSHFRSLDIARLATFSGISATDEGMVPFSQAQPEIHCCFLTGVFNNPPKTLSNSPPLEDPETLVLPRFSCNVPLPDNRPMALWGVSQYAMLLLGSIPKLSKVHRLFDSSKAKIDRSIGKIKVEHPNNISSLSKETILILPRSPYIPQMRKILEDDNKPICEVVEI